MPSLIPLNFYTDPMKQCTIQMIKLKLREIKGYVPVLAHLVNDMMRALALFITPCNLPKPTLPSLKFS